MFSLDDIANGIDIVEGCPDITKRYADPNFAEELHEDLRNECLKFGDLEKVRIWTYLPAALH
jgi:hypothetical protein